jgi:hypothetical protein
MGDEEGLMLKRRAYSGAACSTTSPQESASMMTPSRQGIEDHVFRGGRGVSHERARDPRQVFICTLPVRIPDVPVIQNALIALLLNPAKTPESHIK